MKQRVVAAAIGILITLPLIVFGGLPLAFLGAVIGVLASLEMSFLLEKIGISVNKFIVTSISFLFILAPAWFGEVGTVMVLLILLAVLLAGLIARKITLVGAAANTFVGLYAGFFLGRLILLREIPVHGLYLTVLLLLVVWASDIFAYGGGSLFGNRKLAPSISPNKTVEGSIAGIAGAIFAGAASYFFYNDLLIETIVIAVVAGAMTQFGDLFESQIKRWAGVKDSGTIMPGHGGVLDRIDGLIFASAASYYIALLFRIST